MREAHAALPVTARADVENRARLTAAPAAADAAADTSTHSSAPAQWCARAHSLRLTSQAIRLRYENSSDVGVFAKLTNSCAETPDADAG